MPGFPELALILVILVIVFGATQLPALGAALGRAVHNFRRARQSRDEIQVTRVEISASPPARDREPDEKTKDRR
jgi:sec-independent protein translocase protein TatA